jgi:hypothetical protein
VHTINDQIIADTDLLSYRYVFFSRNPFDQKFVVQRALKRVLGWSPDDAIPSDQIGEWIVARAICLHGVPREIIPLIHESPILSIVIHADVTAMRERLPTHSSTAAARSWICILTKLTILALGTTSPFVVASSHALVDLLHALEESYQTFQIGRLP